MYGPNPYRRTRIENEESSPDPVPANNNEDVTLDMPEVERKTLVGTMFGSMHRPCKGKNYTLKISSCSFMIRHVVFVLAIYWG